MLHTPEPNIKFSENDLIRLQKVQDRLDNYIKEIDIAAKRLTHLNQECEKKENERKYLDDQRIELNQNINSSKNIFEVLSEEVNIKKETLEELDKTSREIHDRLFHHEDTVKERESVLFKKEEEHEKKVKNLSKSVKEHEEKKALVEKAHAKLKETVNSLQWSS